MKVETSDRIIFEDRYIWDDANLWEKAARTIGQSDLAMAVGTADAHHLYLHDIKTAKTIAKTLLGESNVVMEETASDAENEKTQQSDRTHLQIVMERISRVSGITRDENPANLANAQIYVTFADNSGCLRLFVNSLKVHHIYLFDPSENLQFGAYVGWMHTGGLIEQLEFIKQNFSLDVDESDRDRMEQE